VAVAAGVRVVVLVAVGGWVPGRKVDVGVADGPGELVRVGAAVWLAGAEASGVGLIPGLGEGVEGSMVSRVAKGV